MLNACKKLILIYRLRAAQREVEILEAEHRAKLRIAQARVRQLRYQGITRGWI